MVMGFFASSRLDVWLWAQNPCVSSLGEHPELEMAGLKASLWLEPSWICEVWRACCPVRANAPVDTCDVVGSSTIVPVANMTSAPSCLVDEHGDGDFASSRPEVWLWAQNPCVSSLGEHPELEVAGLKASLWLEPSWICEVWRACCLGRANASIDTCGVVGSSTIVPVANMSSAPGCLVDEHGDGFFASSRPEVWLWAQNPCVSSLGEHPELEVAGLK